MPHSGLQKALGYTFQNPKLLQQALIHRSMRLAFNYERLEYLGDSLLNSVVSRWLFARSDLSEGILSQQRSLLVCESALGVYAATLKLSSYIQCAPELVGSLSILADSFEAVCAAIFLDSHWENLSQWLESQFSRDFEIILSQSHSKDFKTQLQEYTQGLKKNLPVYTLIKQIGSEHQPLFEILCEYQSYKTHGQGTSKKQAQQQAAKHMLDLLTPSSKG